MSLVEHILVPDPELRYGLRQIISNSWFKTKYVPAEAIGKGVQVGYDDQQIFLNVLTEMQENKDNKIDRSYVKKCLQANRHNALTAFYYLALKKKIILGETLEDEAKVVIPPSSALLMPHDRQTKKF
jgi:5'-AMP-activated protein kinase, catalytic alpha subunit